MSIVFPYFFYCSADHRGLHSFPTRRSSDLEDGLADVQIEMVSARTGDGVDRLRSLLAEVIAGESVAARTARDEVARSEEHTSELQSRGHLVCRLLLEKKKTHTAAWLTRGTD